MLRRFHHIARPVLMLVLSLYASSLLLCVECLVARDTHCTALVNQLLYRTLLNAELSTELSAELSADANSGKSSDVNSDTSPNASSDGAFSHDHNTHPCLSQIPAFVQTISFVADTAAVRVFFPSVVASVSFRSLQVLYRPPIA
jgi:hypothetical protein